ncbi:hypothetical protein [Halapricum desulfuricans]|uniref:Uncharacterized protein n=1 Tax=Halapricum desulfuricans TaxID=2841257 RepID=A0A897MWH5_9EURY|nr:hypothetical protein [Halapricum desulfuricans]QSG06470.1 hypothetical protein HSR121_2139 [Halapricum desulfuricans]
MGDLVMSPSVKNSDAEIQDSVEKTLAEEIANYDNVDADSVADVLDRIASNNDLSALDQGGLSQSEAQQAVNDAAITNNIYRAIERRVSEVWESDWGNWNLTNMRLGPDTNSLRLDPITLHESTYYDDLSPNAIGSGAVDESNIYDQDTGSYAEIALNDWVGVDFGKEVHILEVRHYSHGHPVEGDGEYTVSTYRDGTWTEQTKVPTDALDGWDSDDWVNIDAKASRIRYQLTTEDSGVFEVPIHEMEFRVPVPTGTAKSPVVGTSSIMEWDIVNHRGDNDGATVEVDILGEGGTELMTGVSDGGDISAISASEDLMLSVSIELTDVDQNPRIDYGALRWIE